MQPDDVFGTTAELGDLIDVHVNDMIEVDTSLPGSRVVRVLDRLAETRGMAIAIGHIPARLEVLGSPVAIQQGGADLREPGAAFLT